MIKLFESLESIQVSAVLNIIIINGEEKNKAAAERWAGVDNLTAPVEECSCM